MPRVPARGKVNVAAAARGCSNGSRECRAERRRTPPSGTRASTSAGRLTSAPSGSRRSRSSALTNGMRPVASACSSTVRDKPSIWTISRRRSPTAGARRGESAGWRDRSRAASPGRDRLEQQIEKIERALPMLGLRVLQARIQDLEAARERHAQAASSDEAACVGARAEPAIEAAERLRYCSPGPRGITRDRARCLAWLPRSRPAARRSGRSKRGRWTASVATPPGPGGKRRGGGGLAHGSRRSVSVRAPGNSKMREVRCSPQLPQEELAHRVLREARIHRHGHGIDRDLDRQLLGLDAWHGTSIT